MYKLKNLAWSFAVSTVILAGLYKGNVYGQSYGGVDLTNPQWDVSGRLSGSPEVQRMGASLSYAPTSEFDISSASRSAPGFLSSGTNE